MLFFIATTKHDWEAEVWGLVREEGRWSPCFARQFNNWELEEVLFLRELHSLSLKKDEEDKLSWKETKCSKFTIKSLYTSLAKGGRDLSSQSYCGILGSVQM